MLDRLNTDLDVLLIFAGLFSAVDTAFVIPAITALSPSTADQTNHLLQYLIIHGISPSATVSDLTMPFSVGKQPLRQSCVFLASLCCSLVAAASAMLAKQWLKEYACAENTGSVEEQVKERAEKFAGAERWGLRVAVEALPLLLLISLTLFFYGLTDFLFGVNRTAEFVVMGFAVAGTVMYALTVIAAVAFATCPYRTAVSFVAISIRDTIQDVLYPEKLIREWRTPYSVIWHLPSRITMRLGERMCTMVSLDNDRRSHIEKRFRELASKPSQNIYNGVVWLSFIGGLIYAWSLIDISLASLILLFLLFWPGKVLDDPSLLIRSAMWMVEKAPVSDHVFTIALNVPFISQFHDMQLVGTSSAFVSLLSKFTESLLKVQQQSTQALLADAVTIGRAIACVLLADPEQFSEGVGDACLAGLGVWEPNQKLGGVWDSDFKHLFEAVVIICCPEKSEEDISPFLDPIEYERSARLRSLVRALSNSPHRGFRSSFDATIYLRQSAIMGFRRFHARGPHKESQESRPLSDIPPLPALFLDGITVDEPYLSSLSHTLSEILRLKSPKHKALSMYAKAKRAWVTPTDLPQDILSVLDAFLGYYKSLAEPREAICQQDQGTLTTMLQYQRQLLVHLQVLYLHFDVLLKRDRLRSRSLYRSIHITLNSTIEQLNSLSNPNVQFVDETSLSGCQNELMRVLESLLLSEGLQLAAAEDDLAITANHAKTVCPTSERLIRGILYRYFLLIAYPPAPLRILRGPVQRPHAPAQLQNLSISPVLTSALRLSVWLYPNVDARLQWDFFEDFIRLLITGNIDGNPGTTEPAVSHIPEPVVRALVFMASNQGVEGLMEGQGGDWASGDLSARERGYIHREAAGVLFLRAWERATGLPGGHDTSKSWASATAIEAFKRWVDLFQGKKGLEIRIEDVVIVKGSVSHDLVFGFVQHAFKTNFDAAIGSNLTESAHDLIQALKGRGGSDVDMILVESWENRLRATALEARRFREARRRWNTNQQTRCCGLGPMAVA
ncbi:hypothetical protein FRB97_009658 [Tulasnella sp. 331]|nr:hypothetical protein FRB97_009658 [Tulasnella sp. 331]